MRFTIILRKTKYQTLKLTLNLASLRHFNCCPIAYNLWLAILTLQKITGINVNFIVTVLRMQWFVVPQQSFSVLVRSRVVHILCTAIFGYFYPPLRPWRTGTQGWTPLNNVLQNESFEEWRVINEVLRTLAFSSTCFVLFLFL